MISSASDADHLAERRRLYADYRKDLLTIQLSNSENFDRSILSLSSALLAVSVAFIRGPSPSAALHLVGFLWSSWIAFAIAIVLTVLSFMKSQAAIDRQFEYAAQYYLQGQEDALAKANYLGTMTSWLNRFSALAFVAGVALTIVFAIANLPR